MKRTDARVPGSERMGKGAGEGRGRGKTRPVRAVAAVLFLVGLAACAGDGSGVPEIASELGVDRAELEARESGLWIQVLQEGSGREAEAGQRVVVHYTGWLTGGEKFDSSRDRGQPFAFLLGQGRVIQGWDEGVAGMREGGRRILVIPPQLAYGERGQGPIPPGAWLVFDVELLQAGEGG